MLDPIGIKNVNFSIPLTNPTDEDLEKFRKQRLERGFDDTETWNLDNTIALFIVPRLKRFKEVTDCYPHGYESIENWKEAIQKMIDGFELWITHDEWDHRDVEKHKKVDEALQLFAKEFKALWW
jgi:hypothetical protein